MARRHVCDECTRVFPSNEDLQEHYRTAHTAELSAFGGGSE